MTQFHSSNHIAHIFRSSQIPVAYVFPSKVSNYSRVLKSDEDLHVFVIDDNKGLRDSSIKAFFKAYGLRKRSSREYWLLDISSWPNVTAAIETFASLPVDVDDELYWYSSKAVKNNASGLISIWEMYRKHVYFPLSVVSTGNWSENASLNMVEDEKWDRRRNLTGVVFRVATLESKPYITSLTPIKNKNGFFEMRGMFAEVFFALQEVMNFSFTVEVPQDGSWGALQPNGSWTGMVKMLQDDKLDIGISIKF